MAAVMPMRYGSGACAGAGAAASAATSAVRERMRPRMSGLLCERGHFGRDASFLVGGVHRIHEIAVALEHQPALDLARGCHGLAFLLGVQLARQHAERLHLL